MEGVGLRQYSGNTDNEVEERLNKQAMQHCCFQFQAAKKEQSLFYHASVIIKLEPSAGSCF